MLLSLNFLLYSRDIHGPGIPGPCMPEVKLALCALSDFTVAIATVHWLITARFEGYFSFFAALRAYCGKHLAWGSVTAASVAL